MFRLSTLYLHKKHNTNNKDCYTISTLIIILACLLVVGIISVVSYGMYYYIYHNNYDMRTGHSLNESSSSKLSCPSNSINMISLCLIGINLLTLFVVDVILIVISRL